jgi:hypothetical protein
MFDHGILLKRVHASHAMNGGKQESSSFFGYTQFPAWSNRFFPAEAGLPLITEKSPGVRCVYVNILPFKPERVFLK